MTEPGEGKYIKALEEIVSLAISEDLGDRGDITSEAVIPAGARGAAVIIAREPCTISGMAAGAECCRQVDPHMVWLPLVDDSQIVPAGAQIARLEGAMRSILAAERTIINFISHLSGIATLTGRFNAELEGHAARIAATRKTSPGMRLLEKQAVADGGGETHRQGLYDAILIKDNHIAAAGSVSATIERVRRALGDDIAIEVEVDTRQQLEEVLESGADRALLDNMSPDQVRDCVKLAAGRLIIEVSGGITLANVRDYAETGAEIISTGALTMSAPAMDFSLEITQ
ncbi:MAG: carboxylating nicotinate-nucleotide diphosphorylase [Thermoleophilia bacterium]|jgi:nicotinate-nucleotide pyrophosphorylase (carboxylating)